ncbi:MAG: class I SAM-dependent methyltransferase [Terriglobales bacterium]
MQKSVFLGGEGDAYLRRNLAKLNAGNVSEDVRLFARYLKPCAKILEIGCANGVKLTQLQALVPCEGWGIDPSAEAIRTGSQRFPNLHLSVGTADQLEFPDASFDFVIFGFCLYLVDRPLLTRVMAEADRVLRDRGFLGITDFDAQTPLKRPYTHHPGVWSYKLDYGELFASLPHFVLADKISYSHSGGSFTFDPQERVASWVLAKDHEGVYVESWSRS